MKNSVAMVTVLLLMTGYAEEFFTKNGMRAANSCSDDAVYWKMKEMKCLQKEPGNMHFHCLKAVQSGIRYVEMCRQRILVPKGNYPVYNEVEDEIQYIPCSNDTFQDYDEYSNEELFYKCLIDKTDLHYSEGQLQCTEQSTTEDRMVTCDHKNYYRFEDTRMSGCYPGLSVWCINVPESECSRATHEINTENKCVAKAKITASAKAISEMQSDVDTKYKQSDTKSLTNSDVRNGNQGDKIQTNFFLMVCCTILSIGGSTFGVYYIAGLMLWLSVYVWNFAERLESLFLVNKNFMCKVMEFHGMKKTPDQSKIQSEVSRTGKFDVVAEDNVNANLDDDDTQFSVCDEKLTWTDDDFQLSCSDLEEDVHDFDFNDILINGGGIETVNYQTTMTHVLSLKTEYPKTDLKHLSLSVDLVQQDPNYGVECSERNHSLICNSAKLFVEATPAVKYINTSTCTDEIKVEKWEKEKSFNIRRLAFDEPSSFELDRKIFGPESDVPYIETKQDDICNEPLNLTVLGCNDVPFYDINAIHSDHFMKKNGKTNACTENCEVPNIHSWTVKSKQHRKVVVNKEITKSGGLSKFKRLWNLSGDVTSARWRDIYSASNYISNRTSAIQPGFFPVPANVYEPIEQQNADHQNNERREHDREIPYHQNTVSSVEASSLTNTVESPEVSVTSRTFPETISSTSGARGSIDALLFHLHSGLESEALKHEWARYRTFWSFPLESPANPTSLARLGWYYEGRNDETVCFCCKARHANWRFAEDINAVHARLSPRCPFVTGGESGNVPIHHRTSINGRNISEQRSSNHRSIPDHESLTVLSRNLTFDNYGLHSSSASGVQNGATQNLSKLSQQQENSSKQNVQHTPQNTKHNTRDTANHGGLSAVSSTTESLLSLETSVPKSVLISQPTSTPAIFLQTCQSAGGGQNEQTAATSNNGASAQRNQVTPRQNQHSSNGQTWARQQQLIAQRRHAELMSERQQSTLEGSSSLGINTERPRYPNYAIMTTRASTFRGFPAYLDQTPTQMAKAGFFYAGYGDYCRCFFCGGGLRNWERGDDPWVEHARWFPRCVFVKQNKGQVFVDLVLQRQREMLLPNVSVPTEGHPEIAQGGVPQNVDMQSSAVQNIQEMGYTYPIIARAVSKFREDRGHGIPLTVQPLLEILFTLDTNVSEQQTSIPPVTTPQTAQQGNSTDRQQVQIQTVSQSSSNIGTNDPTTRSENKNQSQNSPTDFRSEATNSAKKKGTNSSGSTAGNDRALTVDELHSIQEENIQLKEQMNCKICLDNKVCIIFLPCGHLCSCAECAPALPRCPICRVVIKGSVKTYLV